MCVSHGQPVQNSRHIMRLRVRVRLRLRLCGCAPVRAGARTQAACNEASAEAAGGVSRAEGCSKGTHGVGSSCGTVGRCMSGWVGMGVGMGMGMGVGMGMGTGTAIGTRMGMGIGMSMGMGVGMNGSVGMGAGIGTGMSMGMGMGMCVCMGCGWAASAGCGGTVTCRVARSPSARRRRVRSLGSCIPACSSAWMRCRRW